MLLSELKILKESARFKKGDKVLYWPKGQKLPPIEGVFDSLDLNKDYCYIKPNAGKVIQVECSKLSKK